MSARYHDAHQSPKGAGDARPTALQIVQDENMQGALVGKTALVTGTSSGIGIETVRALAATGARVFATARNLEKAKSALGDLLTSSSSVAGQSCVVELVEMDNESLDTVRAGTLDMLKRSGGQLSILVCNAGIMATPYALTKDGFESQFGVCHAAHFVIFELVKDALLKSSTAEFNSRVVMVSSMGHRSGKVNFGDYNFSKKDSYAPWPAYGQAKTANIYLANEIERRYGSQGLHALSLMPGGIATGLQTYMSPEQKDSMKNNPEVVAFMKNLAQGASTTLMAAVGREWEGKGGKYLEDCEVAVPHDGSGYMGVRGYADYAYDEASATRLYDESLELVAKWLQ